MVDSTNNPFAMPDDSSVPEAATPSAPIRDVLGGDEGKVVTQKEIVPEGFVPIVPVSTPVAKLPAVETPPVAIPPVVEPQTLEVPTTPTPSAETPSAPVISVMPTEAEAKKTPITKPLREIPLQTIPEMKQMPVERVANPETPAPSLSSETLPQKQSAIRTLQSDIAHTVNKNQLSIAGIALAQKEKGRSVVEDSEEESGRGKRIALTVGSIVLVLGGLAALVAAIYFMAGSSVPFLQDEVMPETLLPAETISMFDTSTTTRATLLQKIDSFVAEGAVGSLDVRALLFTEQIVGTTTETAILPLDAFFELIGSRAPGRLVRTLGPNMMFGAIGNEPLLLTTHTSYENAFAGLLEWEPDMEDDLSFIVRTPLAPAPISLPEVPDTETLTASTSSTTSTVPTGTSSAALPSTTTPATTSPVATTTPPEVEPLPTLHTNMWKDIVIKNVDARALIRDDGEILLLYAFLKNNLLLFASRRETVSIVLEILATPQFGE